MAVTFEYLQTRLSRGRRSRNKVSVGEPAEGSLLTDNSSINDMFPKLVLIYYVVE